MDVCNDYVAYSGPGTFGVETRSDRGGPWGIGFDYVIRLSRLKSAAYKRVIDL